MNRTDAEIVYVCDMDAIEPECIAIRIKSCIVFCYPVCREVLELNPKVITAGGMLVKRVQPATRDGETVIVGEIDGNRLVWDMRGRFIGGESDETMRLVVPERYFMRNWRDYIRMSNSEWAVRFQRRHENVVLPEKNDKRPWGR